MPRKDKGQSDRFIRKAKELGVDESGGLFERALKKIIPPIRKQPSVSSGTRAPKNGK